MDYSLTFSKQKNPNKTKQHRDSADSENDDPFQPGKKHPRRVCEAGRRESQGPGGGGLRCSAAPSGGRSPLWSPSAEVLGWCLGQGGDPRLRGRFRVPDASGKRREK